MSAITSLVQAAGRECAGGAGNNETWVYASMTREKTFSILLIAAAALLIAAALAAMFRPPGAEAAVAGSRLGNGKAAPAIKPDAIPRHSYRGQCIQCHRVVPAPAISLGAAPPTKHVGKGVCTNCHAILNPSALGNPGTLVGGFLPAGVTGSKWLGVEAENFTAGEGRELGIPPGVRGVIIDGVTANSRAERAGLVSDDVIVSVNGQPIATTLDLWEKVGSLSAAAALEFRVYRNGGYTSVLLAGDSGTSVGGFFPGGAGRGFGGGGCFLCPGCGLTRPPGGVGNNLACPGCGARMCWKRR